MLIQHFRRLLENVHFRRMRGIPVVKLEQIPWICDRLLVQVW